MQSFSIAGRQPGRESSNLPSPEGLAAAAMTLGKERSAGMSTKLALLCRVVAALVNTSRHMQNSNEGANTKDTSLWVFVFSALMFCFIDPASGSKAGTLLLLSVLPKW